MSQGRPVRLLEETSITSTRLASLTDHLERSQGVSSIDVESPVTGETLASVPASAPETISAVVEESRTAQREWERTPFGERAAILERFADLVVANRTELLDLIQLETGKARIHALQGILDVPSTCSYYVHNGPAVLADDRRQGAFPLITDAVVTKDPVGVVGVISPWNYPMMLSITDAIPALLAGNAVVCKPDERTPFAATALADLLEEAGLPAGVFQVVTGEGGTAGSALIDAVEYVAFTGGTETGRAVAERAGRNLIGCSLELGGKNPLLVLEDADVAQAARGAAAAAYTNAGQLCLAPERIYVAERQYEAFLQAFLEETRALTLGHAFDFGPDIGSLIDANHLERVDQFVTDAKSEGATVLTGGRPRPDIGPCWYEPTVLTDVDPTDRIACEETFGPVVSVTPVRDTAAAIERANDSPYGLNASVWTADRDRGRAIARQIECGTVCINDGFVAGWSATGTPMGGVGDSGLGRRQGPEGIDRFLEARTIATSRVGPFAFPSSLPPQLVVRALSGITAVQRRLRRLGR